MPQPLPSTLRIDAFLEQPSSVRTPEIVEADPRNFHILAVAGKATRERIGATGSPVRFVRANPLASHPAARLRQSAACAARCFPRASAAIDGGETVRRRPLADIWRESPAFRRFRGADWMPEPCRSCERREIDWGDCRCQAFELTGEAAATDPACELSPRHDDMLRIAEAEAAAPPPPFDYRRIGAR